MGDQVTEGPKPTPPRPASIYPPPPAAEEDTAESWALYAADLFRSRADWRMSRTAAAIAQALAAAEQVGPDA